MPPAQASNRAGPQGLPFSSSRRALERLRAIFRPAAICDSKFSSLPCRTACSGVNLTGSRRTSSRLIFGISYQYPFGRRFGSSFGINGPISALSGKKCNKINVEQMTFNQEVSGSIPDALTKETQYLSEISYSGSRLLATDPTLISRGPCQATRGPAVRTREEA